MCGMPGIVERPATVRGRQAGASEPRRVGQDGGENVTRPRQAPPVGLSPDAERGNLFRHRIHCHQLPEAGTDQPRDRD